MSERPKFVYKPSKGKSVFVIPLDTTSSRRRLPDKPQSEIPANKLQAEYAMKIRGTLAVSNNSASSNEAHSSLDMSMFPGAVSGQVLMEGLVTLASAGAFGPNEIGVLNTKDGQVYPDDMLFKGFIGHHVRVVKNGEGFLVKKV